MRVAPDQLFELICTPERLLEWNVSVERAQRLRPDEPVGRGSRARFSGRVLGQTIASESEVVEFEPPWLFATRTVSGPSMTTRFRLAPLDHGTEVFVDVEGRVPGGALAERLAAAFLRGELRASLDRLRTLAEARA